LESESKTDSESDLPTDSGSKPKSEPKSKSESELDSTMDSEFESQSGSATDLRYCYGMSYCQSRACRCELCCDVAENGMAWCDVVFYVNKIVGKLWLFGGGGGVRRRNPIGA